MKHKRVVVYYRKSTKVKGKGNEESVAYQQEKIHQYAMDNGLEVVREFFDIGVTGAGNDRPELLSMYCYLEEYEGTIDEVLFYSIERFGRDMSVNIELLQKVVDKVGKATFVRENMSSGAEHFNMMFLIYSGIAENDRNNLKRNLRDGRRAKVLRYGNFDGNIPPLGYIVDSSTKRLIVQKDTFSTDELAKQDLEIVESIFRSYLLGKSLRQIAKHLNSSYGLTKRGCKWSYKSVQYILRNPVYIGTLAGVLEGTDHYYREESNIEAFIDPVIFTLVQKKLDYETTGRRKHNKDPVPIMMICRYCAALLETEGGCVCCKKCRLTLLFQFR